MAVLMGSGFESFSLLYLLASRVLDLLFPTGSALWEKEHLRSPRIS